jgi:hypothetical protein
MLNGFIPIEMAKIVVGSPSLTQPLLLYPGLGPAMLEQHRWSYISLLFILIYMRIFLFFVRCDLVMGVPYSNHTYL